MAESCITPLKSSLRSAAFALSQAKDDVVDAVLADIAALLVTHQSDLLTQNNLDIKAADEKGVTPALRDRLLLTKERIEAMAASVRDIAALENPCGKTLEDWKRPNGLRIQKISVPIGVLGMIYESRPNVTIDAACLALKSRNAIILRGGSESFHSSLFLHGLVEKALMKNGLPTACVVMIKTQDRAVVDDMLAAHDVIDVMIPRGGKGLTSKVMEQARMPVFAHLDGNCHIYVHPSAKADMVLSVIRNAKLRRTGICGAVESLLFDTAITPSLAGDVISLLLKEGVCIVGDANVCALNPSVTPATEDDWRTEYLDKKVSIKYVSGVEESVAHINTYGSHHTDAILSEDDEATNYFLKTVDSAIVAHNASTQFADGGEFGFGAEIGIGTGKLHARGPVGLKQLCTFKYILHGDGHIRTP